MRDSAMQIYCMFSTNQLPVDSAALLLCADIDSAREEHLRACHDSESELRRSAYINTMDPHQTGDLEAQKPPEEKDENCDVKDDVPGTNAAGALSTESPRPSINADSRDPASASKSDTENRNSADLGTGGMSQAPEGDPFSTELMCASRHMPIVSFEKMARMNILVLQNELAKVQKDITSAKISGEDKSQYSRRLEDLLHRYSKKKTRLESRPKYTNR